MALDTKTETLELRMSRAQKDLVRKAAEITGKTMSEFVLSTVEPVAKDAVDHHNQIRLTQTAWKEFVQLTEEPAAATPFAKREMAEFLRRSRKGPKADLS